MAQSLIQRRQEAERARVEAYEYSLRHVSQQTRPPPDFENAIHEVRRGFAANVVRDERAWKPRLKTRDAARLRLAAARHLFARYPEVKIHLYGKQARPGRKLGHVTALGRDRASARQTAWRAARILEGTA